MDEQQLAEIEARANAATPPPWRASGQKGYVLPSHGEPYKVAQLGGTADCPGQIARADERLSHDTDFISAARQDVPALVAEVRRLQRAVAEEREACARLCVRRSCSWSTEDDQKTDDYRLGIETAASQLAQAIRARNSAPEPDAFLLR